MLVLHLASCPFAQKGGHTLPSVAGSARGVEDGLAPRNIDNHGTSGSQRVEREPFKLRPVRTAKRYSSIRRHTMSESNKDILRAGYAAFNRQDIPGIMGMFDENIEWTEPEWVYGPPGGTLHGRDEVLHRVFEPISEDYESLELDPREYYGEGDTVVVVGSFKVRPKSVSQTLDVPFAHVWQLRDGKCVSMRNYIDVAELYERQELRRAA